MSRQLIDEFKMQALQNCVPGLESDIVGDFNFFLGDLNYRLDTTYREMNNTNVHRDAIRSIPTLDQLTMAFREGFFPSYVEQPITFLPTYKMEKNKPVYINKKDQAPSFCDRIMFKNNMPSAYTGDFYRALHDMYGSDHRPVQLGLTLKDFDYPEFADFSRLLDTTNPRQGYGQIKIQSVNITNFDLSKSIESKALKKQMTEERE